MQLLNNMPGPHDIPFAAPLWAGVLGGIVIGFIIFKVMDLFIKNPGPD